METIREIVLQEMNEERYNRKHIDAKIRKAIEENPQTMAQIDHGLVLIQQYMAGQYYDSKMQRIEELKNMDIQSLVMEIFIGIAYCLKPELFTSVSAQMACRLAFSDRREAITTVAELMAVLCITDAFDITKEDKMASLMVESRIQLPQSVIEFIENSEYLPPMVCQPLELTHNFSSGYLTHNDSLILRTGNHHHGDICLDVLNTMNSVALRIDTDFVCTVEEEPTFEIKDQEQQELWDTFKRQSYAFYSLMVHQGNRMYLTHKVDKRGRIYASGYHITTQGTAFKKAMLELANEEIVTGVP